MDAVKISNPSSEGSNATRPLKLSIPMGHRWYVYGDTEIDKNGNTKPLTPIRKPISDWRTKPYIQTVLTAADGSNLLYGLALDFDFDKAAEEWKSRDELDSKKIRAFLAEKYPVLSRFLCTWTRSTGGKGLGVVLFFDPFLLQHEKTGGVRYKAEQVHRLLITVLNSHGLGCDKNASGLLRFTPNWRNPKKILHIDEFTIKVVQRHNERLNVLTQVHNELRRAAVFKGPTRRDLIKAGVRFAVKGAADEGLAKIYAHILDSAPESLCIASSFDSLSSLSGLSEPTLRRYLSSASWVDVKSVYGEGVRLTLNPNPELSERAFSAVERPKPNPRVLSLVDDWDLPEPEFVGNGDRNNYLWRRAVILRNEGVTLGEAISQLRGEASRIPGAKRSRNCRRLADIVSSIFRHTRDAKKSKRKIFPLEALETKSPQSYDFSINSFLNVTESHPFDVSVTKSQSYYPPLLVSLQSGEAFRKGGKDNSEVHSVMVSPEDENQTPHIQGVQGDSPLDRASERHGIFDFLKAFVPAAAEKLTSTSEPALTMRRSDTFADVIPIFEAQNKLSKRGKQMEKGKVFRTIREARAAKFKDVNPLDRFEKAYLRCLSRHSDEEIRDRLEKCHSEILISERMKKRYFPQLSSFKRIEEAFSILPPEVRLELISP